MRTASRTCRSIIHGFLTLAGLLGVFWPADAEAQVISKRVGIVYSKPSATHFYDEFAYSQLFMAMQHQAMMAGIPFDMLTEDDLTVSAKLDSYQALVFPQMSYVTLSKYAAVEASLTHAVQSHAMGIIAAGDFMVYDENGKALPGDPYSREIQLLGIQHDSGVWGPPAVLRAATSVHPAMTGYVSGEAIISYEAIWFDTFRSTGSGATQLATATANNLPYPAVIATQTGGRNVHFANDQFLGDTDLVWSSLQWVVYGTQPRVALKLGRNASLFSARNDMDESMYNEETETVTRPLYELLVDYKAAYNFVGSFFINIGNKPNAGEATNWTVSKPLYLDYIALGNEIGTHSWTHPDDTVLLTSTQLDYEFRQSALEISKQLGVPIIGTAIPGNPENLTVDRTIAPYFKYISGRSGMVGWGSPGANGWLSPADKSTVYLSMSMSPDWTLVGWLNYTAAEAQQIWRDEFTARTKHGSQPLVHFLWHDYAPTGYPGFTEAMYSGTFSWLKSKGTEFVTAADAQQRIRSFVAADFKVSGTNPLTVELVSTDAGRFSSMMHGQQNISQVTGWYAYDEDQIFLPKNGGTFVVSFGSTPADLTHITELPMRANLISLSGDGKNLNFSFEGEGTVKAKVASSAVSTLKIAGADSYALSGTALQMTFKANGLHTVAVTGAAPTCTDSDKDKFFREGGTCGLVDCDDTDAARYPGNTEICDGKDNNCDGIIPLNEFDADSDLFRICAGDCDDSNANINPGKAEDCKDGIDNNCDGKIDTNDPACIVANKPPVATGQSVITNEDTTVPIMLAGTDPENNSLTYTVGQPSHGIVSGIGPNVAYTPVVDYFGPDSFTFTVNDGVSNSNVATVTLGVNSVNDAPRFTVSPIIAPNATVGVPYVGTLAGTATDVDSPSLSYTLVDTTTWLKVLADGTLSGTPAAAEGPKTWSIVVSDGNATAQGGLTVTVGASLPVVVEASFVSIAAEDGWLRESTETSGVGGAVTSNGTAGKGLRVGDDAQNRQIKSIVSFDTSSIPDGSKILSATLMLTRGGTEGTNPLTTHGACLLDIKGGLGFGGALKLEIADFAYKADVEGVGTISMQGGANTVYSVSLSDAGLHAINQTGRTQLRFAFVLDDNNDFGSDLLGFYAGEAYSATQRPRLVVKYQAQ